MHLHKGLASESTSIRDNLVISVVLFPIHESSFNSDILYKTKKEISFRVKK